MLLAGTTRLQDYKTASMHRQNQSAPFLDCSDADACKGDDHGYDDDDDDDDDEQQQHSALHLANLCKDCCAAALLPSCLCPIINCMAAANLLVQQDNLCIDIGTKRWPCGFKKDLFVFICVNKKATFKVL